MPGDCGTPKGCRQGSAMGPKVSLARAAGARSECPVPRRRRPAVRRGRVGDVRGSSGLQPPAGYGRLSTDGNSGGGLPVMQKAQRHDEVPTAEQRLAAPPKRDRFPLQETRRAWRTLSAYERFEQVVALVLTV